MDGALLAAQSFTSVNANFHRCKKKEKSKPMLPMLDINLLIDQLSQCGSVPEPRFKSLFSLCALSG